MSVKSYILTIICLVLVLSLGIGMVLSGCNSEEKGSGSQNAGATPSGTQGDKPSGSEGTTLPGASGQPETTVPGGNTDVPGNTLDPDASAPSVDLEITDREEFPTEPNTGDGDTESSNPTTPQGGTQGGTQGGNQGGSQGGNQGGSQGGSAGPELDENGNWTYEYYRSRTGQEQMEYFYTFPSVSAFNEWYNAAKKAYDEAHPKETIGPDGIIDLH